MVLDYSAIAGQLVKDGIQTRMPLTDFEVNESIGVIKVNSLIPKLNLFIKNTKVWGNPLAALENRKDNKFGAGIEQGSFLKAAVNKKLETSLFPYGDAEMVSQVMYDNYGYNIPISVVDDEVDQAVFNAEQAGAYAANKVMTAAKAIGQHGYAAYKRKLANAQGGTVTVAAATENSDGTGGAVAYAKTVVGWAGKIIKPANPVIPKPVRGTTTVIADSADALELAQLIKTVCEDFTYEGTDYNKLAVETFTQGRPNLIMETGVLTAMDNCFMDNAGFKGFPTVDARTYLRKLANIVEIDVFPDKPVTAPVSTNRIVAEILDPEAFIRINRREDVEPARDVPRRSTGYSYQCKALIGIDQAVNTCAILCEPA